MFAIAATLTFISEHAKGLTNFVPIFLVYFLRRQFK